MLRFLFYCALFFYFIMDDLLRKCSSFFLAGLNYMGLVIELYILYHFFVGFGW